jgi:hypothetical protein
MLSGVYPVSNQALDDALNDALQEAEECGYDNGYDNGYEDVPGKDCDHDTEALKGRYEYLCAGGTWQLEGQPNPYLAGFLDAMKTLGVTP